MKELSQTEVSEVSGAGILADAGKVLGGTIGRLLGCDNPKVTDFGAQFGEAIGGAFESVVDWVNNFFNGKSKK